MRNVDIISGLYQAFGRGDLPSVLELLHPAVSWHEAEGSPYHPGRNGWTGPDAIVENLLAKMVDDWAEFTVHPTQLHDAGDLVVVEGRYSGQHQVTGKTLDCQVCHIWTVEGGKVTRFQQYVDTAQLQDVMGPERIGSQGGRRCGDRGDAWQSHSSVVARSRSNQTNRPHPPSSGRGP